MGVDGFLHRAIPWVVAAFIFASAIVYGYASLAQLMRCPVLP